MNGFTNVEKQRKTREHFICNTLFYKRRGGYLLKYETCINVIMYVSMSVLRHFDTAIGQAR